MKSPARSMAVAALVGAVLMLFHQVAAGPAAPSLGANFLPGTHIPGEVLVKFKPGYSAQDRLSALAVRGHTALSDLNRAGWVHVKIGADQTMAQVLAAYRSDPGVEHAQPNYVYRATAAPNDTRYGELWGFRNIGQTVGSGTYMPNTGTAGADIDIERAWDHITDCSSVVVAVVDSGVNYDQEDLTGNMWDGGPAYPHHGTDFVDLDNDPMDLAGHGTHVAGIIGGSGNNASGVTGVCWKSSIMAVRVLDATGAGNTLGIQQGIDFAVSHGAKVINMSLGARIPFDKVLSDAIGNAMAHDAVVVVAAGNDASDNDALHAVYPCNFTQPNILCVAALDQNFFLATFSNWGVTSVDVGAPGTNVVSTWAGVQTTIADDFNTGGVLDWTTAGGGWAYRQLSVSGSPVDALVNPGNFPSGAYANGADNRVYKTFDLSGKNAATLNFHLQLAVQPGDALNLNYRAGAGDPFLAGGHSLIGGSGTTGGALVPFAFDLSVCTTHATCSVGFQLLSNASGTDQGAGIAFFDVEALQLNSSSYNTESGTSMATPMVAGLAAMLRAYNPQYNYGDVVSAVRNGGGTVGGLLGRTASGKAIDAMSSLAYINPPTGVTAALQ